MIIVGAGLSGLLAAHTFPNATILEAMPEPREQHKALLRFRSDSVSKLTGIPFRKVRVRKGIWFDERFVEPNIRLANMYSTKCLGHLTGERSIWNMEAADRWIAPEDFYWQMVDALKKRIQWNASVTFSGRDPQRDTPMISTAPLPTMTAECMISEADSLTFKRSPIRVARWRVHGADVHQTVYFPSQMHNLYRASMTGDMLIMELIGDRADDNISIEMFEMLAAFGGLSYEQCEQLPSTSQRYGKISPVDDRLRKRIIARLTNEHGIYSLGRFATWRNVLLDDVVEDAAVIKRLIHASPYERAMKQV